MISLLDILQYPLALAIPFLAAWLGKLTRDAYWEAHKYRGAWKPR